MAELNEHREAHYAEMLAMFKEGMEEEVKDVSVNNSPAKVVEPSRIT